MTDSKDIEGEKPAIENQPGISPTLTEEEKDLAANAYEEFEKKNFDTCIVCLNKLLVTRPKDPKILHNKAVAEYYSTDFVKTEEYRQKVADVCQQSHINIENVDSLEDVDHCVIYFNQAVILFHLHQYYAAIAILDKLFQFIEPLDEHLTRKVCFLLLELYLSTHQPEKALGLIGYIENMLFGSGSSGNGGNGGKGHKAPTPEKEGKEQEGSREKDHHNKELSELNRNELYRPKLQHYKARCYIMLKSTKACKREIKNLMSSGVSIPAVFLRSQLEYLRGNYRKAIKVLNTAFGGSSTTRPYRDTGDNLAAMFYNNVGCIHFYMGKPNLGAYYFSKSLQEHQKGTNNVSLKSTEANNPLMSRPLHTLDITDRYQMLYNLGLQFLHSAKPQQAFDHLIEAVQVYPNNPRLWLRLAECCIQEHNADNSVNFHQKEHKKELKLGLFGSGAHRKVFLTPSSSDKNKHSMVGSAMPVVSLEFSCLCLSNALLLLPEEGSQSSSSSANENKEDSKQTTSSSASTPNQEGIENIVVLPVPPSNSLQKAETGCLRNAVLVAHAYVSLCLGDVLMSLKYAEILLAQPKISGVHRFLGHLYAGESLLLLDRIGEAIQHLHPDLVKDMSLQVPSEDGKSSEDRHKALDKLLEWYPTSVSTAKVVFQYNLAVAYTLRGELEKASETLKVMGSNKGPNTDFPIQAVMLTIYIQLQQGHVETAKSIIKQHLPQYR